MVEITYSNMAATRTYDDDEDDLQDLTQEEIDELNDTIDDPDNELLPAGYRAPDQTTKVPTGPFDREHLIEYLKEEAKNVDYRGEGYVPFEKKIRGKVWKNKDRKKTNAPLLPDDLSEVLDTASEEELMELAAVLGIHGMLTQKESDIIDTDKAWDSLRGSGLKKFKPGITKATKTKTYTDINAVNELDLDAALERLKSEDPTLTELNVNNHMDMDVDKLTTIANCIRDNKHLKTLYMANTIMPDRVCKIVAESLKVNKTLETLNLESNEITREGMREMLKMLEVNTTLKELKLAGQSQKMGHQLELQMGKSVAKNHTLLRFGYNFDSRGPRHTVNKFIMRNIDADRDRRQKEEDERRLAAAEEEEDEDEHDENEEVVNV